MTDFIFIHVGMCCFCHRLQVFCNFISGEVFLNTVAINENGLRISLPKALLTNKDLKSSLDWAYLWMGII
jgi:hypothetical protein